jgi:hypothetical protein
MCLFGMLFVYRVVLNCVMLFFGGVFCAGVMYSGEYDVCDVTLSVYPHRESLKNMPGHGGNRTFDLWNTSPMLRCVSEFLKTFVP